MKENYAEKITCAPRYTIRRGFRGDGHLDFLMMTTNTPENRFLNVKMLGYEECTPDKPARTHTFDGCTLHFIIDGNGSFDGIKIGKNDGFMAKKNCLTEYAPDKKNPWTYCWINFDGEMADEMLERAGFTQDKCTFSFSGAETIEGLIKGAVNFDYSDSDVGTHLSSVLLDIFAVLLADLPDTFTGESASVMETRVKTALEFIYKNYTKKNCIYLLAAEENVNERYISHLFRMYSDASPQQHLIRVRIEEAKRLLRTTGFPVGRIAEAVGYDDGMQFAKIFKKHTGLTPTEYRRGGMDTIREYD